MIEKAIKNKIVTITQEPEMRQLIGRGKGVQMPIYVNIFGDSAIERVSAENGDIIAAMSHILSILPQPRIYYLKYLAMIAALESGGNTLKASEILGISRDSYYKNHGRLYLGIKRLNEEGFTRASTTENTRGLSP